MFQVGICSHCTHETVVFGEKEPYECQSCMLTRFAEWISPSSLTALETAFGTATKRLLGITPRSACSVESQ